MFMICVVAFACCASEQIISQWSSGFIESEFSVSKLTGDIAGPCMFALMMGTVRIIYSQFGKGINLKSILFSSGISCFFCYLVISLSKSNFISLAMFAICGGAVGLMWPCILSVASKRQSKSDAKFFGIISTFGDLGCAIGPWLAGIVASKNELTGGMSKAILSFSFFPLIVAFGILIVMPKKRKHVCKINNKTSGIHEKFK